MLALVLHPREVRVPRHQVRASARRLIGSDLVAVRFEVQGAEFVDWPAARSQSSMDRLDELWKKTCLECFVGGSGPAPSYFEWNFSSTGEWAAYSFTDYRAGLSKPEVAVPSIERILVGQNVRFEIDVQLTPDVAAGRPRLGLTAVVIEKGVDLPFYWALAHVGDKPDFHLRESFTLELES